MCTLLRCVKCYHDTLYPVPSSLKRPDDHNNGRFIGGHVQPHGNVPTALMATPSLMENKQQVCLHLIILVKSGNVLHGFSLNKSNCWTSGLFFQLYMEIHILLKLIIIRYM